jgi:uncharacterized protein YjfI (DUF2170 family)
MTSIQELTTQITNYQFKGHTFSCLPIQGEQGVLRVEVSELEEMPIFVTVTETQILCISYLFHKNEIFKEKEVELNQYLLELNVPMPLSAFAVIEDYYAIFGALSCGSTLDSISDELVTLAQNSIDSLQALEEFVK